MMQTHNAARMCAVPQSMGALFRVLLAAALALGMVIVDPGSALALDGPKSDACDAASASDASLPEPSVPSDPAVPACEAAVGEDNIARLGGLDSVRSDENRATAAEEPAAADPEKTWSIGRDEAGDVTATLRADGTLEVSGAGAMADFTSADEAPWASWAAEVTGIAVDAGVTTVGAYAFAGLDNARLVSVKLPEGIESVGKEAFADCRSMLAVDLTSCSGTGAGALRAVGDGAFCGLADGAVVYVHDMQAASLIKSLAANTVDRTGGNVDRVSTALAVANEGSLPVGWIFASRHLATGLEKAGFDFVKWTTDAASMHPATSWKALSSGTVYYAKYAKSGSIAGDPSEYPGFQGLDQQIQLLDLAKLPTTAAKQGGIEYYGNDAEHFLNRIVEPYSGSQDIVFAFGMSRGGNANGGDGAYQKSFSLPYVSILDDTGSVVASYDDGAGKLKLFSTVFDHADGKSQGNTINAFRIGVEAGELPAGTYTLRFDKGLGANNGTSFLDRNVDFVFTVTAEEPYRLTYDRLDSSVVVAGIQLVGGADAVDVYIPDMVDGMQVAGIAKDAFKGVAEVRSISVPDAVTRVDDGAFSQMSGLSFVKMSGKEDASGAVYNPVWGTGVFDGSADCLLYGWPVALSVKQTADAYENVTYCPLEDGVYVGGARLGEGDVLLTKDRPSAVTSVVSGGEVVTDSCTGRISNTNVVGHAGTTRGLWQDLTACANGKALLVVRDGSGSVIVQGTIAASGFDRAASTERTLLAQGAYQGNGATVRLVDAGAIETVMYDETVDAFDNYLVDAVVSEGATFSLSLGGPGSAWDSSRWDWDDWTANHLNDYLWIEDESGAQIAGIGNGLHWVKLRGSNGTDNTVVLGADVGVLKAGRSYTLVAAADMSGHNVAARLMRDVRWTFTTKASDIAEATAAAIPEQTYAGTALEPAVSLSVPVPERVLWDEATEQPVVVPASTRTLTESVDYTVSYADNAAPGTGKAVVKGQGGYAGSIKTVEFSIAAGPGDLSALKRAIESACSDIGAIASSEDGRDVPAGGTWTTPGQLKAANAAMAAAQAVAERDGASEDDIARARADLADAMAVLNAAVRTARVDTAALASALDAASLDMESTLVDSDAANVDEGAMWTTQQVRDVFATAVSDAQAVLGDSRATQNAVDEALDGLAAAKEVFDGAKRAGSKASAADTADKVPADDSGAAIRPTGDAKALARTGDFAAPAAAAFAVAALGGLAAAWMAHRRRRA